MRRYAVTIPSNGDYRFCVVAPDWVQDELRDSTGTSITQTTNRNGEFFSSPEFVQTLAAGNYVFDVFAWQKTDTVFSVVYRAAGDVHPACQ